jgi:uncharacterized membrane protein
MVRAGKRLVVSLACGAVVGGAASLMVPWQAVPLLGWCATAAVFVTWALTSIAGKDAAATATLATAEDSSRTAADLMLLCASAASLGAVLLTLLKSASLSGLLKGALTGASVLSIVLSWAVVHTVFLLRYARLYYEAPKGGVDFNEEDEGDPSYVDFAYLSLTLGMTYQVSDTNITQRAIRATALRHALLSYLFGTAIIATTINLVAGLAK